MSSGKQRVEGTLERRLFVLSVLPEAGGGGRPLSAAEIARRCMKNGLPCTTRTAQRDLVAMSEGTSEWSALGVRLEYEAGATVQQRRWRHAAGSKLAFMNRLGPEQALTLALVDQALQPFVPQSAWHEIGGDLHGAQRVLARADPRYARYRERVRIIPEGPPRDMAPPVIDVLRQLSEALLKGEQVDVRYAPRSEAGGEPAYRLHPVGLVQQGLFHWLLAVQDKHIFHPRLVDKVASYRCDRIRGVATRRAEAVARGLPTLDEALAAGRLEFFSEGAPVELVLRFAATAEGAALCTSFREAPLGQGQAITPNDEGGYDLRTRIRRSLQLEWLLQRYADRIRVLAPAALADHVRTFARNAAALQG